MFVFLFVCFMSCCGPLKKWMAGHTWPRGHSLDTTGIPSGLDSPLVKFSDRTRHTAKCAPRRGGLFFFKWPTQRLCLLPFCFLFLLHSMTGLESCLCRMLQTNLQSRGGWKRTQASRPSASPPDARAAGRGSFADAARRSNLSHFSLCPFEDFSSQYFKCALNEWPFSPPFTFRRILFI